jgi:hypothetical protein
VKLSFRIEGKIKNFHNKEKTKELITIKPALLKIIKGILPTDEEDRHSQENVGKNKLH